MDKRVDVKCPIHGRIGICIMYLCIDENCRGMTLWTDARSKGTILEFHITWGLKIIVQGLGNDTNPEPLNPKSSILNP